MRNIIHLQITLSKIDDNMRKNIYEFSVSVIAEKCSEYDKIP